MRILSTAALTAAILLTPATPLADEAGGGTTVTIYSTARPGAVPADSYRPLPGSAPRPAGSTPGYAVVKQEREMEIPKGRSTRRFSDVAALLDPTTVRFSSLTDPEGTRVLEQSYEFDLVGTASLLQRYVDREIAVEQAHGDTVERFRGRLLSAADGLILGTDDGGVRTFASWSGIELPELPGGLITRPTLVWDLEASRGGTHRTRVSYETQGVTWWTDYNLVFRPGEDENAGKLDVGAWVSVLNQSGASYPDTRVKLVAGDVQRAQAADARPDRYVAMESARAPGFEEQAFFEYHLYTLGRRTSIPDNSTKQIELFDAANDVPAEKLLVFAGQAGRWGATTSPLTDRNLGVQGNTKVDVHLRFRNDGASGLGIPLPSGRVRVNQLDPADGSLEFVGEDVIDHTPKDEVVQVRLGNAFDVVGERVQTDYRLDTSRKRIEEAVEIRVRNHKTRPVRVLVRESLYRWSGWRFLETSVDWERVDARTVHFPVEVPADGEATVRYRVEYAW